MKHFIRTTLALATLSTFGAVTILAEPLAPGYVDFGKLSPSASGGEFVEVRLNNNLISMVARLAEREEPEIGEILRGLRSIRVNVMELDEANRAEFKQRVSRISGKLDELGWDRVVTVRDGDEQVTVLVKTRGEEAVEGLFVSVIEGDKEAVLVNVVGDIRPEKLAMLGERFDIEPLKKAGLALK